MSRDRDRTTVAVVGIAFVALLVRTVELGARVFHWDEGRVGHWVLRFHRTGEFGYRPIIHGPFLPVVDNAVFDVLGPTDFAARLPVAVVGAALPLVALGFRAYLSDRETIALAGLLAVDPLLVYYSRFLRSDVLVATFAFAALAFLAAARAKRRAILVVPAAASLGLAFTAKENALIYVACFLGAGALLVDHRLVRTARHTDSGVDAAVAALVGLVRAADRWTAGGRLRAWASDRWGTRAGITVHLAAWTPTLLVLAAGAFLSVIVFFYAPRPDLWGALAGTRPFGPVVRAATVGSAERFTAQWVQASHGNPYPAYVADLAETLVYGSGVTVALAAVGFLVDGYATDASDENANDPTPSTADDPTPRRVSDGGDASDAGPAKTDAETARTAGRSVKRVTSAASVVTGDGSRPLVAFAAYWAAASAIGYPVATDIQAPWAAIHVTLPLTIPAAVGLVSLTDTLRASLADDDLGDAALAGVVVVAAAGGVVGANADYWNAASVEDEQVIQWAQPANDVGDAMAVVASVAADNDGTDLLFVGTVRPNSNERLLFVGNESRADTPPPPIGWFDRLPLPWYTERADVAVTSTPPDARFDGLPADPPPAVIAFGHDREPLADRLPGYAASTYDFRLWRDEITLFVDRDALAALDRPANVDRSANGELRADPPADDGLPLPSGHTGSVVGGVSVLVGIGLLRE